MCWGTGREKKEDEKLVEEEKMIFCLYFNFFFLLAFHEFLFGKEFCDMVVITSGFLPGGLWLFLSGVWSWMLWRRMP